MTVEYSSLRIRIPEEPDREKSPHKRSVSEVFLDLRERYPIHKPSPFVGGGQNETSVHPLRRAAPILLTFDRDVRLRTALNQGKEGFIPTPVPVVSPGIFPEAPEAQKDGGKEDEIAPKEEDFEKTVASDSESSRSLEGVHEGKRRRTEAEMRRLDPEDASSKSGADGVPEEGETRTSVHMKGRLWTEYHDRRLIEGYSSGLTHAEIAHQINRTCRAVSHRIHVLRRNGGIPKGMFCKSCSWTPSEDQQLIEGCMNGLTHAEIGRRLNRTRYSVTTRIRILEKNGVMTISRRTHAQVLWTPEERSMAQQLRMEGKTFKEIGKAIGRTDQAVSECLKTLRKKEAGIKRSREKE